MAVLQSGRTGVLSATPGTSPVAAVTAAWVVPQTIVLAATTTPAPITAADRLYYWDATYGLDPAYGSDPTFSRSSGKYIEDRMGTQRLMVASYPGFRWASATGLARQQALRLEPAATNRLLYSEDVTQWTAAGAVGVTADQTRAPDGEVTADKVEDLGTSGVDDLSYAATGFTASARVEPSVWVQPISTSGTLRLAASTGAGSWDVDLASVSGFERITRSHAAVTVNTEFTASAGGACTLQLFAQAGGPLDCYLWGGQLEENDHSTSYVATAGTLVSRAVDALSYDYHETPAALTLYVKHIEAGNVGTGSQRWLVNVGYGGAGGVTTTARLGIYSNSSETFYRAFYHNGSGLSTSVALAAGPSIGQLVEHRVTLSANGAVQLHQSLAGADETSTSVSTALGLPLSWGTSAIYFGTWGAGSYGTVDLAQVKLAAGVRSLPQMRRYRCRPTGELAA